MTAPTDDLEVEQCFDQVLQGHETRRAPEFVDHRRDMLARRQKQVEQVGKQDRARDKKELAPEGAE